MVATNSTSNIQIIGILLSSSSNESADLNDLFVTAETKDFPTFKDLLHLFLFKWSKSLKVSALEICKRLFLLSPAVSGLATHTVVFYNQNSVLDYNTRRTFMPDKFG